VRRIFAFALLMVLVLTAFSLVPVSAQEATPEPLVVFGAYATPIEEPWDGVIHQALQKAQADGRITYTYVDNIGYSGDMETVLRDTADNLHPAVIFGDAFGNEEAVRRVAKDYPEIAFVFGSGLGPADPNLSVFDNWIHEPSYLSGLLAGKLSKSGIIGVVAGYPVPEVNRIVNAFIQGAKESNADSQVQVTFINSWFDPAAAKEAALAQVDAGADVLFAERFGVIEAAQERHVLAFGSMSDQNELAPDTVVTGPVWNMDPTVDYVLRQVAAGVFTAQDLKDFSMMAKGGASLAPFHSFQDSLDPDVVKMVTDRQQQIMDGLFRVDINEETPANAVIPEATPSGS
jgi:basic membrane protein A and related proteins